MSAQGPELPRELTIVPSLSIEHAMAALDQAGTGALVVCDDDRRLLAVLTDGDIRRALLRGHDLGQPVSTITGGTPLSVRHPIGRPEALALMNKHDINHLPVVDDDGVVLEFLRRNDLVTLDDVDVHERDRVEAVVVEPDLPLGEAIARLDLAGTGALLLCDERRRLRGVLTDGDVRRAVLGGVSMQDPCGGIASTDPIRVGPGTTTADALRLMNERDIDQLPVVGDDGVVVDFLLRKDLVADDHLDLSAVIMAGGFGKRLLPLTESVPKPMLPVGDKPLLERTIGKLQSAGIRNVNLTTHYLPENIVDHFGDGQQFGVNLNYSREDQPLGTAGGLRLMDPPEGPMVVMNGDILTGLSFADMHSYHRRHDAELTVGVRRYEIQVPFGVVDCEDVRVTALREKPTQTMFVNAGVYLLEPSAWASIPDGIRFDMTDLIQLLLDEGRIVASFPILEYWLDVGRPEDYERAQEDVRAGRV
jgi:dTDP-glucose pyrophosphorylase/CBS domain-containing protein